MKAGGQDVLEKSAHELWSGQTASSRHFAIAWLDHEGDALIVESNDPAVGEGGSESWKIKGERMEDLELVLRFVALYSLPKGTPRSADQNLDEFLNDFVEKRCQTWTAAQWDEVSNAFARAMTYASKVFKSMAFRKYSAPNEYRKPINRGLFETESVLLARHSESDLNRLSGRADEVIQKFGAAFNTDQSFQDALLYATGRGSASNKRLETMESIFTEVLK